MEQKRDEQLLAEHLAHTPGAFDQLVARYAEELFSFFLRFVGNRSAADDLVQETFLQVHLSAASFDPGRTFKPWLYTIAANKGRDWMRARGRRPVQSLDAAGDSDGPTPGMLIAAEGESAPAEFERQERRRQVREVIDQMPEMQRTILLLGYFQKLPYAEMSEILDIPIGTVKSRLHAAVGQFAKMWLAQSPDAAAERSRTAQRD